MLSPFQITAPTLRKRGWSVLPYHAKSKRPAINEWPKLCIDHADESVFQRWMSWSDNNIGVALGIASNMVAIDLDNDIDGLHAKIESLLPKTPLVKRGNKGKTLFYQFSGQKSQSFTKDGVCVFEILSTNRISLLPPSLHPDTGIAYEWIGSARPEDIDLSDLPTIPHSAAFAISLLFEKGPQVATYSEKKYSPQTNKASLEDIDSALEYIPPDDYDVWVRVGMAIKDELGENGFQHWDDWSRRSEKYSPRDMRSKWNSFRRSDLGIGTVFYYAMDHGWSYSHTRITENDMPDFFLDGHLTGHYQPKSVAQVINEPDDFRAPEITHEAFPARLITGMTGLPQQIAEFINETSIKPQPVLAMAASIPCAGTIMGHKVQSETNLRTNFYTMGLAHSGSGKDHARGICNKILYESGLAANLMGRPKSGAGLVACLRDQGGGVGFLAWDEFGRVLKQLTSFKASTHEAELIHIFMELFSSSRGIFTGAAYANNDGKNPPKPIDQPCYSLYGTSVPGHFYEAMTGGMADDGFLARMMIFESCDYVNSIDGINPDRDVPQSLLNTIDFWKRQTKNARPTGDADLKIRPRIVLDSSNASKLIVAYRKECDHTSFKCSEQGETAAAAVWSRSAEHASKLALVAHEGTEISESVMQWAIDVSNHCSQRMVDAIGDNISSNEIQANIKRVLRYIKDATKNGEWLSRADIGRKFDDIRMRERNDVLLSLVERGDVEESAMKQERGRPKTMYRYLRK